MNRIYKTLLFLAFLCLGLKLSAQESEFNFGVKAGLNLSSAAIENSQAKPFYVIGYQVGVTVDYALSESFYLQSGLSFTTKGSAIDDFYKGQVDGGDGSGETQTFNQMYLQLPLYVGYKLSLSENTRFVFNTGPYFSYGLGGNTKRELTDGAIFSDGSTSYKYKTFGDDPRGYVLKRFDAGLGIGAGLEFQQMVLAFNYELGLSNITNVDEGKYRNRSMSFTLGYKFR